MGALWRHRFIVADFYLNAGHFAARARLNGATAYHSGGQHFVGRRERCRAIEAVLFRLRRHAI